MKQSIKSPGQKSLLIAGKHLIEKKAFKRVIKTIPSLYTE